jgi:hypothetical protein
MADGKHCPTCGKDIGIWPVFSAGLPNRIWCPHCSARLSYSGIAGVVFILLVVLAGAIVGAYFIAAAIPSLHPDTKPFAIAGILLGLWVLVELVVVCFLRNNRQLVRLEKEDPKQEEGYS